MNISYSVYFLVSFLCNAKAFFVGASSSFVGSVNPFSHNPGSHQHHSQPISSTFLSLQFQSRQCCVRLQRSRSHLGIPSPVANLNRMRGGGKDLVATPTALQAHSSQAAVDLSYNASSVDAGILTMDEIWDQLHSSSLGLTNEEAKWRLQRFGPNSLEKPPTKSLLALILEQFEDRLVQILLVVAVLSALFSVAEVTTAPSDISGAVAQEAIWKSFVEPLVIVAILALNAAVGVSQSRSASDSLAALEQLQAALCTVVRHDPLSQQASYGIVTAASNLVPGDIIELRTGDKIPADGRLISLTSSVLTVDEGPLTGESVAVFKLPADEGRALIAGATVTAQRGMLFAGTCVTQGAGRVVVTQTGMDTQFGRIQRGVLVAKAEQPKTPLQLKLDEFGETLTVIIGVICLAVWIVSIPKMNDPSFSSTWEGALYFAKVAVALGVAAIPEGLPAVITLCLSLGTRRMAQRNVIVRNLPSVETLGCTSVICTDKTGTLTTNEVSESNFIDVACTDDNSTDFSHIRLFVLSR
jgi:magnesium-transporting ATPase (P-type)